MDGDFFLDAGIMTLTPEITTADDIFRPNWDKTEHYSQLESTLFSMTSSSPVSFPTVSKLNSPIMDHLVKENIPRIRNSISMNPNLPFFPSDPGFAERAAKFSCFGSRSFNGRVDQLGLNCDKTDVAIGSNVSPVTCAGKFHRVSSSPVGLNRGSGSASNSNEGSSVSEHVPSGELGFRNQKDPNSRKRKGGPSKGAVSNTKKEEDDVNESKRLKKTEEENGGKMDEKTKPPEPPKDYIHVRARRGQATDSHFGY